MRLIRSAFPPLALLALLPSTVPGAPYWGDTLTLAQPDGSPVKVRVYGDEFYHRVESLDGYTLTQDPKSRRIQYARLGADGKDFHSTGIDYLGRDGGPGVGAGNGARGRFGEIPKHQDLRKEERLARSRAARARLADRRTPPGTGPGARSGAPAAAAASSSGEILGLTLLIDFPDRPASVEVSEIDDFLNQTGYTGNFNNGSVKDYFRDVSGGKLTYTNHATTYYTARHPVAYYADPDIAYTIRAVELIAEALDDLELSGFDFSTLSVDEWGNIRAINAFYAGYRPNAWSQGLWPHQSNMSGRFSADGVMAGSYQITDISDYPTLGTFCHENGHMLFGWPDFYDYGFESSGTGHFDLMAYQGGPYNPVPPNPYLRALAGWDTVTVLPPGGASARHTHTANSNTSFRFNHPSLPNEYFLIESRLQTGRSASLPDQGLLIWHVDEYGSNDNEQMTPSSHYRVSLEQADGRFDMERNANYGDYTDAFQAGEKEEFAHWTLPDSRWWNGDSSGLNVLDIGPLGPTQSFTLSSSRFLNADVGNPGRAGSYAEAGGVITLKGGGADIWGTADQFHFRHAGFGSDGEVVVKVEGLQNTHPFAKAGVMLRESLAPGSRNVLIALTPGHGVIFQHRTAADGPTLSVKAPGKAPRWVKLQKTGSRIAGYHSPNGRDWKLLSSVNLDLGASVQAGLAVTSHDNARLTTATFSNFRLDAFPWKGSHVGNGEPRGGYSLNGETFIIQGDGAGIGGTEDDFFYVRQLMSGDGRITARVASLQNTHASAMAGVMFRDGEFGSMGNSFMGLTAASGAAFQYRRFGGEFTEITQVPGVAAPRWVRLERRNGRLSGYLSADGTAWTLVDERDAGSYSTLAGLAVSSHSTSRLATAVFDNVTIQKGFPELHLVTRRIEDRAPRGNGDGEANPGEELDLVLTLGNWGALTAPGAKMALSTTDACLTLLTSSMDFGDVAPNTYADRPFRIAVSSDCPDGHVATLSARMTDSQGEAWSTTVELPIAVRWRLFGTVTNPSGPLRQEAEVACRNNDFVERSVVVQPDGNYALSLSAGTWSCWARTWGYYNESAPVEVAVPPDRRLDLIVTRPLVALDGDAFIDSLPAGQTRTVPLRISNPGDGPLTYDLRNPAGGYAWTNSDHPGGPAFAWTDIRSTGTSLSFTGGVSGEAAPVTLSFPFPYFDSTYTTVFAMRYGHVRLLDEYSHRYNHRLPEAGLPGAIAAFWDEIGPNADGGGAVYFQDFGDSAVFQYDAVPRLGGAGGPYTFQIVLYPAGVIRFYYHTLGTGVESSTIGIQGAYTQGLTVVSDSAFLHDSQAVEIRPLAREMITFSPASGTVAAGESATVNVTLDATGLSPGRYAGPYLLLNHNSPAYQAFRLEAILAVTEPVDGGGASASATAVMENGKGP